MSVLAMVRRGTSHANVRGSASRRRALRAWMVETFGVAGVLCCALCGVPLLEADDPADPERFVVGRIVPGCRGGRYVRGNVRPECPPCSSGVGGGQRAVSRETGYVLKVGGQRVPTIGDVLRAAGS